MRSIIQEIVSERGLSYLDHILVLLINDADIPIKDVPIIARLLKWNTQNGLIEDIQYYLNGTEMPVISDCNCIIDALRNIDEMVEEDLTEIIKDMQEKLERITDDEYPGQYSCCS